MPFLNRRLGNPVLSFIGRLFFPSAIGDFHCGLRAFRRDVLPTLDLQSEGMEFASEMVVKATLNELAISEVPTTLSPALRTRKPHLNPWRDGWRHLRFLLLFSPRWLFFYPGLALMLIGAAMEIALLPGTLDVFGVAFDVHTMVYASAMTVVGYQAILFAVFARVYAMTVGFIPPSRGSRSAMEQDQPRGRPAVRRGADPRRARPRGDRPRHLGRDRLPGTRLPRHAAGRDPLQHDADARRADGPRQLLPLDPRHRALAQTHPASSGFWPAGRRFSKTKRLLSPSWKRRRASRRKRAGREDSLGPRRLEAVVLLEAHALDQPQPGQHRQDVVDPRRGHRDDHPAAGVQNPLACRPQLRLALGGDVLEDGQHRDHVAPDPIGQRLREAARRGARSRGPPGPRRGSGRPRTRSRSCRSSART